jgi:SAM-dependent methyltransferase
VATTGTYEPETHWADRALRSGGDPLRAACLDDPLDNACIDRVQHRLLAAAFDRLKSLLPLRASRLLDYGCGPGRWVPFFRRWGCQYSGVDLVEPMVTLARTRWPGTDIRRLEGDRIPYGAGTFDVVVSIAVLHHNAYLAQERILAEFRRVLKPGGYLLLFEAVGRHAPPGVGESPRPLEEWIALLRELGLLYRWHRGARYSILGAAVAKFRRHARQASERSWSSQPPASSRLLRRVDAVIDPWLLPVLPTKYHTRAAMVFYRQPSDTPLEIVLD